MISEKENDDFSNKGTFLCAFLALTLGPLGVHKFYVGRTRSGFLHILASFFIIGIPLAMFDLYKIFKGNFIDVYGKKLRPMPILAKGKTYQERLEENAEWIDNTPVGKWIKRNELSSKEKELLKKGDIKEAFEEVKKRMDES
tara:strand:- start:209 stop:634 length:426 start_codon:yes stop_codon:yes gene_type:complete